jgi:multidrug efflux pump
MNIWAALLRQPVLIGLAGAATGLFGLVAVASLPVRSSPIIPYRMIDISTNFPGADAQTMDKFVTLPLETAISALAGVKYVTGSTMPGNSDINAFLQDGADPNTVFAETLAGVNAERSELPPGIQAPELKLVGDNEANQELNITVLFPPTLSKAEVTSYAKTNLIPRFETVPGIGPVWLYSGGPSLRVTMDPARMQALGVTPDDVAQALGTASTVNAAGTLRDSAAAMPIDARPGLDTPADFDTLPVAKCRCKAWRRRGSALPKAPIRPGGTGHRGSTSPPASRRPAISSRSPPMCGRWWMRCGRHCRRG